MASSLIRKLNRLSDSKPSVEKSKQTHVIIHESFQSIDDAIYRLDYSALHDMGYTGSCFDIEKALFIDTETTGLSGGAGTVAFLIGIGFIEKGRMTVKQFVIPDYSCETEMLDELAKVSSRFEHVIHFNGSRFDMPLLKQRFVMKRMDGIWREFDELDLLPPSRKVWKLRLGCCRLKYLEETVLDMPRDADDIPGSEIPARYFECVRTGNTELLRDIIEHNRQDIYTLAKLLVVLNGIYHKPEEVAEQLDVFSLGKAYEKLGNKTKAKRLYSIASVPRMIHSVHDLRNEKYAGEANLRLYHLYRRNSEFVKCESVLKCMIRRKQQGDIPFVELAKLYEHKLKRYKDALDITNQLLRENKNDEYLRRKHRLEIKINNNGG